MKATHNKSGKVFKVVEIDSERVQLISEMGKDKTIKKTTLKANYTCKEEKDAVVKDSTKEVTEEIIKELHSWSAITRIPKDDADYWVMDDDGDITCVPDTNTSTDKARFNLGNYFVTEEDAIGAKKIWEQLIVPTKCKRVPRGKKYYHFELDAEKFIYDFYDERDVVDLDLYEFGNYFATEKEAKESKLYEVITKLIKYRKLKLAEHKKLKLNSQGGKK